jgi:cytochrome c
MKALPISLPALVVLVLGACGQAPSEGGAGQTAETGAAATPAESAAPAVAAAPGDAQTGKRLYIYCQACHSINAGGMNKVGPNLYGVIGNAAGQVEGFAYSQALLDAGLTWDDATLNAWIDSPSTLVPGTTMVFAGIRDAQHRRLRFCAPPKALPLPVTPL